MRHTFNLLWILILTITCLAQVNKNKGNINPTPDPNSPFKVYIPKDLDDCFIELKKMLHPTLISEMKNNTEEDMIEYHHGLGTWIRNNWALWAGSHLSKYFNNLGIYHPDDMSGIILKSFWRHLNSKPIKLDEQVERYKRYWKEVKEKESRISPVSKTAMSISLKAYGGKSIKLGDYTDQVIVLCWWSIFCNPQSKCDDVLPHLVEIKKEFTSKGVEIIGLTGIYPPNELEFNRLVKKAINKYKINFPIVWDDDKFSNDIGEYDKFGYSSLPQVFVISRNRYVIKRIRGFDKSALREAVTEAVRDNAK
jgi:alkyl hydroperoxide reductase subunit AhpC